MCLKKSHLFPLFLIGLTYTLGVINEHLSTLIRQTLEGCLVGIKNPQFSSIDICTDLNKRDQPLGNIKLDWFLWNDNYQATIRTNYASGFPYVWMIMYSGVLTLPYKYKRHFLLSVSISIRNYIYTFEVRVISASILRNSTVCDHWSSNSKLFILLEKTKFYVLWNKPYKQCLASIHPVWTSIEIFQVTWEYTSLIFQTTIIQRMLFFPLKFYNGRKMFLLKIAKEI